MPTSSSSMNQPSASTGASTSIGFQQIPEKISGNQTRVDLCHLEQRQAELEQREKRLMERERELRNLQPGRKFFFYAFLICFHLFHWVSSFATRKTDIKSLYLSIGTQ